MTAISLRLNGEQLTVDVPPVERLSDILRSHLSQTGTKVGCDAGDCGACTVLIDGEPACSCLTAAAQIDGSDVVTVEGLAGNGTLHRLQESFLHFGAAQCGICTPGMLISAEALLRQKPNPDRKQVEDALGGVLCRCTGYQKIIDAVMHAGGGNQAAPVPASGEGVGSAIRHLDGQDKVTGKLNFGADHVPAGAVAVRVIRSPHHHARFTFGDRRAFLDAHPGIELVLDADDIAGRNCFGVIPPFADQPVFSEGTAIFRGEAVAAIVGEADAVKAVDEASFPISWEVLGHVLTAQEAQAADAPRLHAGRRGNVLVGGNVERGDPDRQLATSVHQVSLSTSTPSIEHAYIEPEAGYAVRDGDRIVVHGCTQAAHMDRESLADIMGLDLGQVRVVPTACGGGFGSKLDISLQPYVALAAWKLNRPATICYTRSESMRSTTKRHPSEISVTIGCDADGMLTGMDFSGVFNTGAYASWGPTVANRVPVHASGPYLVPGYRARSLAIHTNGPPSGAFRGFGVPQSAIAQECAFDLLAEKAGLDRLEFRLKNGLKNGDSTVTGQVFEKGVGIVECLQVLEPVWRAANEAAAAFNADLNGSPLRKGIGIASCWYGCGNTSLPNPSTIRIGITAEGQVVLHQGAADVGQGANTVIAQIAADALGVPVHSLQLVGGDTDLTPDAGKTSASRQTYVSGMAAKLAGEALRSLVLRLGNVSEAADIDVKPGRIELSDDGVRVNIDLRKIDNGDNGYVLFAEETYDPPTQPLDENGQGIPYAVFGYGAQLVELTVDTRLGTVTLDRITAAHDVGRAINPMLVEGQIEGGIAQGIGLALMEDYQPGRTENLHDYLIPTIGDVPPIECHIVEVPDAIGPYGAKGLGEHVLIPTAPAILNAIRHATGALVTNLPATPDKVRAAILEGSDHG